VIHIEDYAYAWNYCKCLVVALPFAKTPGIGIIFDISKMMPDPINFLKNS
jgi:hypothetical protein